MKNFILLATFILFLIFTSFIKNNTRSMEKKIVILNEDIEKLESQLSEATLEYSYLTSPEYLTILSSKYIYENFIHYEKKNIKKINLSDLK